MVPTNKMNPMESLRPILFWRYNVIGSAIRYLELLTVGQEEVLVLRIDHFLKVYSLSLGN